MGQGVIAAGPRAGHVLVGIGGAGLQVFLQVPQTLPAKAEVPASFGQASGQKGIGVLDGRDQFLGQALVGEVGESVHEDAQLASLGSAAEQAETAAAVDAFEDGGFHALPRLQRFGGLFLQPLALGIGRPVQEVEKLFEGEFRRGHA